MHYLTDFSQDAPWSWPISQMRKQAWHLLVFPAALPLQLLSSDSAYCLHVPRTSNAAKPHPPDAIRLALAASWPLPWREKAHGHVCWTHTQTERQNELFKMRESCVPLLRAPVCLLLTSFKPSPKQLLHRPRAHRLLPSTELSRHPFGRCEECMFSHFCPHLPGTQRCKRLRAVRCGASESSKYYSSFLPSFSYPGPEM